MKDQEGVQFMCRERSFNVTYDGVYKEVEEDERHGAILAEASDAVCSEESKTVDYGVVLWGGVEIFNEVNKVGRYVVIGENFSRERCEGRS